MCTGKNDIEYSENSMYADHQMKLDRSKSLGVTENIRRLSVRMLDS